jgi:hypothetical protein
MASVLPYRLNPPNRRFRRTERLQDFRDRGGKAGRTRSDRSNYKAGACLDSICDKKDNTSSQEVSIRINGKSPS